MGVAGWPGGCSAGLAKEIDMTNKTNQTGQELSDAELDNAVGGLATGVFDPARLKPEMQVQVALQDRLLSAASNVFKARQEAVSKSDDDNR
jgi:hypothetical protein